MPTIRLTGANPSDPKQSRGAAWDAYEKSQAEAAKQSSAVNAAFDAVQRDASDQMESLWSSYASQLKSQMSAQASAFQKEMQARAQYLSAERARESERSRHAKAIQGVQKAVERSERNRYSGARLNANAENSNRNFIASGTRANANAENASWNQARSSQRNMAEYENRDRDAVAKSIERNRQKQFSEAYALAMRENQDRDRVGKLEDKGRKARGKEDDKRFREDYTLATRENQDRDRIARANANAARRSDPLNPNTYRIQNANRLGMRGMRAADSGSWIELHRSQRELDRVERMHGSNPAIAAAIRQARTRIAVGKESQSPGRLAAGQGLGLLGDFLSNPEVALAIAATMGVATAPLLIGGAMQKGLNLTRPYQDPRAKFLEIGRSSGFSGQDLMSQFYQNGKNTPQWMQDLGITPEGGADILQKYGIGTSSPEAARDLVRTIGKAQYTPGLGGLGMDRYASMAGFGRTMGLTDEAGMTDYFRKYAQVTTIAQAQGLDKSKAISNIEGLLKQATSAGGGGLGDGSAIFKLWQTLSQSGNASMRSGEGISRVLGGFQGAADQIGFGGGMSQNLAVSNFISQQGGTGAFKKGGKGWATLFGSQKAADDFAAANPDFMNTVYTAAGQGPGMLMQALGDVVKQQPTLMNTIGQYAPSRGLGGYAGAYGEGQARGTSVFDLSTQRGAEAVSSPKAKEIYGMLLKKGYGPAAASGILSNIMREDPNLDPSTRNAQGMTGLIQWNQERRGNFRNKYGFDIGQATTQQQIDFLDDELHGPYSGVGEQLRRGNLSAGQSAYLMSSKNVVPSLNPYALDAESKTRSRGAEQIQRVMTTPQNPLGAPGSGDLGFHIDVGNMPLDYNAAKVNTAVQQMTGAEGAGKAVIPMINGGADMFKGFSDSMTSFNGSVVSFAAAVDKFVSGVDGKSSTTQELRTASGNPGAGLVPRGNNPGGAMGMPGWMPSWLQPDWGAAPRKN